MGGSGGADAGVTLRRQRGRDNQGMPPGLGSRAPELRSAVGRAGVQPAGGLHLPPWALHTAPRRRGVGLQEARFLRGPACSRGALPCPAHVGCSFPCHAWGTCPHQALTLTLQDRHGGQNGPQGLGYPHLWPWLCPGRGLAAPPTLGKSGCCERGRRQVSVPGKVQCYVQAGGEVTGAPGRHGPRTGPKPLCPPPGPDPAHVAWGVLPPGRPWSHLTLPPPPPTAPLPRCPTSGADSPSVPACPGARWLGRGPGWAACLHGTARQAGRTMGPLSCHSPTEEPPWLLPRPPRLAGSSCCVVPCHGHTCSPATLCP